MFQKKLLNNLHISFILLIFVLSNQTKNSYEKIIVTIIVVFVSFSFSNIASAQCVNKPISESSTATSIYELQEFKDAMAKESKGRNTFFIGLGTQVISTALLCVPITTRETGFDENSQYVIEKTNGLGACCAIVGSIGFIVGSTMEITGLCKWINGASTKRDIMLMCSLNKVVVTF